VSKRSRELSGEEAALWERVAETVKRRRVAKRAALTPAEPGLPPKPKAPSRAPPKSVSAAPKQPPADRSGERRVRRGQLDIGATLDLHGHTQTTARTALARFLAVAQVSGHPTVIVITGMGRGGEGVLKRRLVEWLAEPDLRPLTTGYAPAHRMHGGAGAFYVFVRRKRGTPD